MAGPYAFVPPLTPSPVLNRPPQIPITSDLFFAAADFLWILKLRLSNFDASSVKWDEVEGTNGCPHLYGNFGAADVESAKEFRRGADKTWTETLKGDEWLE